MRKRYRFYNRKRDEAHCRKTGIAERIQFYHCIPWFYARLMQMRWMKDERRKRIWVMLLLLLLLLLWMRPSEWVCDKRTSKNRVRNVLRIRLLRYISFFLVYILLCLSISFGGTYGEWVSAEYVRRNQVESQSQFMRNKGLNCFFFFREETTCEKEREKIIASIWNEMS